MAIADEVERLPADELLVAGPEVDRRVDASVGVVVAAVDVHPDTAELVDDIHEALEVDRDQVVDREACDRPHRLERPCRPAVRVRLVDPPCVRAPVGTAAVHDQVTREREKRHRVRDGVGTDQHDGVRSGRAVSVLGAVVVADDERVGRLPSLGDVLEDLQRLLGSRSPRCERVGAFVRVEVRASGDSGCDRGAEGDEDEQDQSDRAQRAAPLLGPGVARHRRQGTRRQNGVAVAITGCRPADSSLESGPHGSKRRERRSRRPQGQDSRLRG